MVFQDGKQDVRDLKVFTQDLKMVLEEAFKNQRRIIPGRHHESFKSAYNEVSSHLDQIQKDSKSWSLKKLRKVGLTGTQLRFKLDVFNSVRDELLDFVKGTNDIDSKDKSLLAKLKQILKNALTASSVLAGSLTRVIPLMEVVAELIDAILVAMEIREGNQSESS